MSGRGEKRKTFNSRCLCLRCNHAWISRTENPKQCPRCRQDDWDVVPKFKPKPRSGISGITWSRSQYCWQVHHSNVVRRKTEDGHVWHEVRVRLGYYSTIYAAAKRLLEALEADGFPPNKEAHHYVYFKSERERDMYEKMVREARGKGVVMD